MHKSLSTSLDSEKAPPNTALEVYRHINHQYQCHLHPKKLQGNRVEYVPIFHLFDPAQGHLDKPKNNTMGRGILMLRVNHLKSTFAFDNFNLFD